jgi:3-ketosteroid 9alpha-monooxygenase subunit B
MSEVKKAKRIKKLEVMVAEVIRETSDTTTLLLFSGNESLDYKPGHFCTIDPKQFEGVQRWCAFLEDQKGSKEKPRAYSLASSPHEKYLAVTIKEERYVSGKTKYPPLLSPVLVNRTPPGTRMEITGFTGPYYLPDDIESRTDHVVHICAGSGVVPNWSIIKYALHHNLNVRHTLIYGNRSWDDVIYRHALDDLRDQHADKLHIVHALSREPNAEHYGPHVHGGRVDEKLLREYIPDPSAVEVFACGPALGKWDKLLAKESGIEPAPRFMETVVAALKSMGITKDRLHTESYG